MIEDRLLPKEVKKKKVYGIENESPNDLTVITIII